MMKKNNLTNWFFITGLAFFLTTGCAPPLDVNPCFEVVCENDGTCFDGVCFCPAGFIGLNCELFDPTQVQALLNEGITPIELINANIPLENLYGMQFEDGLIFYLNTDDGTGLLAGLNDQTAGAEWGCFGTDIVGVPNLMNIIIPNPETEEGGRLGDGAANTDAILMECNQGSIAASSARSLGPDWYLPSRGELNLMWEILADPDGNGENTGFADPQNLGRFVPETYWSSTEGDSDISAWSQNFSNGMQVNDVKGFEYRVRAVRAF